MVIVNRKRIFKSRTKRSPIWKVDIVQLRDMVSQSTTLADILRGLGVRVHATNYRTLKRRLLEEGIKFDHIPLGIDSNKGRPIGGWKYGTEVLHKNSMVNRRSVRRIVLQEKLIPYVCAICGLGYEWNGITLVLRLDHIDGHHDNHSIENLRFLCPNCDSQLDTYGSKNRVYKKLNHA